MALPSFRGGTAAKVGDLYEAAWTADSLLDLIAGRVVEISLEPQDEDGRGVEFWRVLSDGTKEFHSVKRQSPMPSSAWTPYQLTLKDAATGRSILGDMFVQLDRIPEARAVFVSQDSAGELRELCERARALSEPAAFFDKMPEKMAGSIEKTIAPMVRDQDDSHRKLRRLYLKAIDHWELNRLVEGRIPALVRRTNGADFDPSDVRRFLSEFAWHNLGSDPVRESDLIAALHDQGLAANPLSRDTSVQERIRTKNRAFNGRVSRTLINGNHIARHQAKSIGNGLIHGEDSLLLSGKAGVGKTCVIAQVTEMFADEGVTHLAISMEEIEGAISSVDLGRKLGLPTSPAIVLGEMAKGDRAVLCVDQVDALSFVGGRNAQGHQVLEELVEESRTYPNLRLLLACRSFDLENDSTLKGLIEGKSPAAHRVDIDLLSPEDVEAVLSKAGVRQHILDFRQIELLRTPIHLYLFLAGNRTPSTAMSRRSLFDAYWDELRRRVDKVAGNGAYQGAVKSLANALSDRRQLEAPSIALDAHATALDAMASAGTIVVEGTTVSFFHATFFDYAFARGFVGNQQDLIDWLLSDSQELFRRSQVRQVLEFLRDGDVRAYLDVLGRLLNDGRIRFHLKRLVLDWLGQLSNPMPDEWQTLVRLDENLAGQMLNAIYNKVPWFDLINESGTITEWAESGVEINRWRAFQMIQGPDIFRLRSEGAAARLRGMADRDDNFRQRLALRLTFGDVHHSRAMFDLFLEFIDDGTLDGHGGFGAPGDWWHVLSKMSRENPAFCAEAIEHWLDHQEQLGPPETDLEQIGGVWWSNSSEEVIQETASRDPLAFAARILPRIAIAANGKDAHQWEIPLAPVREHLVERLSDVLNKLSQEDPDTLDGLLDSVSHEAPKLVERLKLRAWAANPEHYANTILRFLIDRRDIWRVDETRLAIQAAVLAGNADLVARLETLILDYRPEYERGDVFGWSQFELLSSIASDSLSPRASNRLGELRRKFGNEAPKLESLVPRTEVYAVPPRIPDQALRRMDDEQLLNAMRKLHETGSRPTGGSDWDEVEFGRQLEQQAKIEPTRFVQLVIEQMPSELSAKFFSHILDGLLGVWPDDVSTAELVAVILRLHELPGRPCGLSIGRAVREIAKEDLPESILRVLTFYAIEDPDPKKDWWPDNLKEAGNMNDAAIGAAINSVRGVAVQAVAALMFERPERSEPLMNAVEAAINDPTLAVRSVAPLPLLALLPDDEPKSLEYFNALCSSSGSILGTRHFEQYLRHFVFGSYEAVRTILLTMADSEDDDSKRVTARLICIAALIDGESRELAQADAEKIGNSSRELRQGAAEVYARNIELSDVAQFCAEQLKRFFNDPDAAVRRAATDCFHHINESDLSKGSDLIDAFVESDAFETQVSLLLYRLKNMTAQLPPSVLTIAERAIASWGPDVADISTSTSAHAYSLSELVVRLYEQTTDKDTKERLLDAIDQMVERNFEGIAGGIAAEDRV